MTDSSNKTHAALTDLMNIGPKAAGYLQSVGIMNEADLRALGPVEAFMRIIQLSPHLRNRMALYALYGALTDQHAIALPEETKAWLEEELVRVGYSV